MTNKLSVTTPVGVLNNNPLMIRKSSDSWDGKIDSTNEYEAFENEMYGVRAGLVKMRTAYKKGFKTIRMMCKYWQPSMSDEEVQTFTSAVERRSQIYADAELQNINSDMSAVASAMSYYFLGEKFAITSDQFADTSRRFGIFVN